VASINPAATFRLRHGIADVESCDNEPSMGGHPSRSQLAARARTVSRSRFLGDRDRILRKPSKSSGDADLWPMPDPCRGAVGAILVGCYPVCYPERLWLPNAAGPAQSELLDL
jgi:hypothetical protein